MSKEINLCLLKEPFPPEDIEWREQRNGIDRNGRPWALVLAYVTNRAIQNRLDEVCGLENWKNQFIPGPNGGVLCGISIRINGEWVTKWDGADNTDIESVKGGLSDAMKRSAVQWGIGRYLYNLEATFARIDENGSPRRCIRKRQRPEGRLETRCFPVDPPRAATGPCADQEAVQGRAAQDRWREKVKVQVRRRDASHHRR